MDSTTTKTKQSAPSSKGTSIAGKTWSVIYPIYLNKKKTLAEGRRVPQDKGLDNPNCNEIAEACRQLGLQAEIEAEKAYSRDFTLKGRVRIRMKMETGELVVSTIKNKRELLAQLCQTIPKVRASRNSGGGGGGGDKGGKKGKRR